LYTSPTDNVDKFADKLDTVITEILNRHCSLQERRKDAVDAKRKRCELERRWRSTLELNDYVAYRKSCRFANKSIVASRSNFYNDRTQTAADDPHSTQTLVCVDVVQNILHLTTNRQIRSDDDCTQLSINFAKFFVERIRRIKVAISSRLGNSFEDPRQCDVRHPTQMFTDNMPPSTDEIQKLIRSMPANSSPLDKIPTSVIKTCADVFAPLIARLVTLSFSEGKFPVEYKHALLTSLLKKEGLDADSLGNYQPISNLHTISKIVEHVYMSRLAAHVRSSPNYSCFQSAYRCGNSTETALLRMLNDVNCAADNKYRTTLLQLNLSLTFDTLDMSTPLRRLRFTYGLSGPSSNINK